MASTTGQQKIDIEKQESAFLDDASRYSFFVLYRQLQHLAEVQGGSLQVRPALSLSYPRSEVVSAERVVDESGDFTHYLLEVNFQGLYGASSPLPNFYTEDLLQAEKEEQYEARAFLDIFHQQAYSLLFNVLHKNSPVYSLTDEGAGSGIKQIIWTLVGLRNESQREALSNPELFLRYLKLFSRSQRSEAGLCAILEDYFAGVPVEISQCRRRLVRVAQRFQLSLGSNKNGLGQDCLLGNYLHDDNGEFSIHIGPMPVERFRSLVNDEKEWAAFVELISYYLKGSLSCELSLTVLQNEAKTTVLGEESWGQLGVDTWVYSQSDTQQNDGYLNTTQLLS